MLTVQAVQQGLGHRTMFCGLGIGNFAALTAADVGFAVGSNEAIVAAQIMTLNTSIAGIQSPDLQFDVR